jgi:hypothetical protein
MFVGSHWNANSLDKTTLLEFYTDQKTILAFQTILSHIFSSWSGGPAKLLVYHKFVGFSYK